MRLLDQLLLPCPLPIRFRFLFFCKSTCWVCCTVREHARALESGHSQTDVSAFLEISSPYGHTRCACATAAAVDSIWHKQDIQGHILALAFRLETPVPSSLGSGCRSRSSWACGTTPSTSPLRRARDTKLISLHRSRWDMRCWRPEAS